MTDAETKPNPAPLLAGSRMLAAHNLLYTATAGEGGLTVAQLAEELGIAKSAAANLIANLRRRHYAVQRRREKGQWVFAITVPAKPATRAEHMATRVAKLKATAEVRAAARATKVTSGDQARAVKAARGAASKGEAGAVASKAPAKASGTD